MVKAWGFQGGEFKPVSESERDKFLESLGFDTLRFRYDAASRVIAMRWESEGRNLDLSSVAKGYAVDEIASLLMGHGADAFFVEIGGEIRAYGSPSDRDHWVVGVEDASLAFVGEQGALEPNRDSGPYLLRLALHNQSVASSGTYRQYFEENGQRYSHIMDPRIGQPVPQTVLSATVITESCAMADGLSTALMVMGVSGLEMVERLDGVEAMLVTEDGVFTSSGFVAL